MRLRVMDVRGGAKGISVNNINNTTCILNTKYIYCADRTRKGEQ